MHFSFLFSARFWAGFFPVLLITGMFVAWELGYGAFIGLPSPVRDEVPLSDVIFGMAIVILSSANAGLYVWRRSHGACPVGAKRAAASAWTLGGIALICPACTVAPLAFFGLTLSLSFLSPFIPLLQSVAVILLVATLTLLLPKKLIR